MQIRLPISLVPSLIISCLELLAVAHADDHVSRTTAAARPSALFTPEGKPERLDFDFGNIKGWIRQKGGWYVEGSVNHVGLRCATYEIGMRFGVGQPGCTNVSWISKVDYGTREQHCNGATRQHQGGGFLPELAKDFSRITCGERIIRCTGSCK